MSCCFSLRFCCCSDSSTAVEQNQDVADTTYRFRARCERHNCSASVAIRVRSSGVNGEQPGFTLFGGSVIAMMQQEQQEQQHDELLLQLR